MAYSEVLTHSLITNNPITQNSKKAFKNNSKPDLSNKNAQTANLNEDVELKKVNTHATTLLEIKDGK